MQPALRAVMNSTYSFNMTPWHIAATLWQMNLLLFWFILCFISGLWRIKSFVGSCADLAEYDIVNVGNSNCAAYRYT